MPRIGSSNDGMTTHQPLGGNFSFTAVRLDRLGATEYTLVTIAVDVSLSTRNFADGLLLMLKTALKSCQKSPRSENLLVRVVVFSSEVGIMELHGFRPLSEIDPEKDYKPFQPDGNTPLIDTLHTCITAMVEYGAELVKNDFRCNGIFFGITDGEDNDSTATARMIQTLLGGIKDAEKLESLYCILIGINIKGASRRVSGKTIAEALGELKDETGFDKFIDAGDATPGKLAKLANFVSQSVSSQSQALGTGGPSQNIAASI